MNSYLCAPVIGCTTFGRCAVGKNCSQVYDSCEKDSSCAPCSSCQLFSSLRSMWQRLVGLKLLNKWQLGRWLKLRNMIQPQSSLQQRKMWLLGSRQNLRNMRQLRSLLKLRNMWQLSSRLTQRNMWQLRKTAAAKYVAAAERTQTKHMTVDNSRGCRGKYAVSFSFRLEDMVGAAECGMNCLGFVGACQCSAPTACPLLHSSGPRPQAEQEKGGGATLEPI